jgi:hypothetical protein
VNVGWLDGGSVGAELLQYAHEFRLSALHCPLHGNQVAKRNPDGAVASINYGDAAPFEVFRQFRQLDLA